MKYDLVVIGSGPAGQKGAITAAKCGKRVAMAERGGKKVGGCCVHTGTIPSKTMREAILHLTGYRQRDVYGDRYRKKRHVTMDQLRRKMDQVVSDERDVIEDQRAVKCSGQMADADDRVLPCVGHSRSIS